MIEKLVYIHRNHCLIRRIRERGSCLIEATLDMMKKEEYDERLLRMQTHAIDHENEAHKDIRDDLEDMDDEYDSA